MEHAPLEAVYIYFDTATYDKIERDEKVMWIGDPWSATLQKLSRKQFIDLAAPHHFQLW